MQTTARPGRLHPSARDGSRCLRIRFRWTAFLASLGLLVALTAPASAETHWKSFKPSASAGRLCVHVSGKDMRYYKLDSQAPLTFTLSGPSRVRILTRHVPGAGDTGEKSYTLRVVRDGKEVLTKRITTDASRSTHLCDQVGHAVGKSRYSYITVPKGKHVFQVYGNADGMQMAVRLYREVKTTKKVTLVSYSPEGFARICTLVTSAGHEYPHYHFNRTAPLRFQVHGPTTLSIYTRADFDQTMLGSISYGIEVIRNDVSHRVFHYDNVRKLSTASYKEPECREILPGERRKMTLKVPKGTWTYELQPAEHGHESIAARILIPKKDVANGTGR